MFKKLWFQVHWLLGITAGLVLAVMGVTGATLSFEDELIGLLNPQILQVQPQAVLLSAPALAVAVQQLRPQARIQLLTLYSDPTLAAKVIFAGKDPRSKRGEVVYVNPYDGRLTGAEAQLRGHATLHFLEDLHRRLAAGEIGKAITGVCAIILLVMTLSGLYLRWPRRWRSWRSWLRLDVRWQGRALLWNLHAVFGIAVLPFYLLSAATGLYWSYDWYRDAVLSLSGETLPVRPNTTGGGRGPREPARAGGRDAVPVTAVKAPDLSAAWTSFQQTVGHYRQVSFNPPARAGEAMQVTYLRLDAPHGCAVSRLRLDADGRVLERLDYADKTVGGKLISGLFPLHSGSFFGRAGQLLMMVASLAMPLFFVTGWLMYLERRGRKKRASAVAEVGLVVAE